jgi:hypothetical protein
VASRERVAFAPGVLARRAKTRKQGDGTIGGLLADDDVDELAEIEQTVKAEEESEGTREGAAPESDGDVLVVKICSMGADGTFEVTVKADALVDDLSDAIGELCGIDNARCVVAMFIADHEEPLAGTQSVARRMADTGASELFMMQREPWWTVCGSDITVCGEGLVATKTADTVYKVVDQLVTGGSPMTEGHHYWELEVTWSKYSQCDIKIGAVRPGLNHDKGHHQRYRTTESEESWIHHRDYTMTNSNQDGPFVYYTGSMHPDFSYAMDGRDGKFEQGDRIGVLLDLDVGLMRFFRNDKRWGPGFTGVVGPLVRAAQLVEEGDMVTALPGAAEPEGALEQPWVPEPPPPDYY